MSKVAFAGKNTVKTNGWTGPLEQKMVDLPLWLRRYYVVARS